MKIGSNLGMLVGESYNKQVSFFGDNDEKLHMKNIIFKVEIRIFRHTDGGMRKRTSMNGAPLSLQPRPPLSPGTDYNNFPANQTHLGIERSAPERLLNRFTYIA